MSGPNNILKGMNDGTLATLYFQCPHAVFSPISLRSPSFTPLALSLHLQIISQRFTKIVSLLSI